VWGTADDVPSSLQKGEEETQGRVCEKRGETHWEIRDYLPEKENLLKGKSEKNEENRKNTEKVVDS